jgi:hypothetical protein
VVVQLIVDGVTGNRDLGSLRRTDARSIVGGRFAPGCGLAGDDHHYGTRIDERVFNCGAVPIAKGKAAVFEGRRTAIDAGA